MTSRDCELGWLLGMLVLLSCRVWGRGVMGAVAVSMVLFTSVSIFRVEAAVTKEADERPEMVESAIERLFGTVR